LKQPYKEQNGENIRRFQLYRFLDEVGIINYEISPLNGIQK
jgi:hypothetical protein